MTTQDVTGIGRQRWYGVIQTKGGFIIIIININGGLAEVPTTGKGQSHLPVHLINNMVGFTY